MTFYEMSKLDVVETIYWNYVVRLRFSLVVKSVKFPYKVRANLVQFIVGTVVPIDVNS